MPGALFDLSGVDNWCPRCVDDTDGAPTVAGLDLYISLMREAYTASRVRDALPHFRQAVALAPANAAAQGNLAAAEAAIRRWSVALLDDADGLVLRREARHFRLEHLLAGVGRYAASEVHVGQEERR